MSLSKISFYKIITNNKYLACYLSTLFPPVGFLASPPQISSRIIHFLIIIRLGRTCEWIIGFHCKVSNMPHGSYQVLLVGYCPNAILFSNKKALER